MKKDNYFQEIRAIAIIFVITIHSLHECTNEIYTQYNLILRQVINCCVAVFIFLSGYFVNIDKMQKKPKKYILERIKRVIIPTIVWYIIYMIVNYNIYFKGVDIQEIVIKILDGSYLGHLYYIIVLVQLILLTPIILKMMNSNMKYLLIIITPIYLLIINILLINNYDIQITKAATLFPAWLIFYYLGLKENINKKKERYTKSSLKLTIILLIIILIINIVIKEFAYMHGVEYSICVTQIDILTMIYSIVTIKLIIKIKKIYNIDSKNKLLIEIGNYSFAIYLSHMLYIKIIKKFLEIANVNLCIIVNEVFFIVMTIGISLGIKKLVQKSNLKIVNKILNI